MQKQLPFLEFASNCTASRMPCNCIRNKELIFAQALIVPFAADQPFWGNRVHAIGACPKPILAKNLPVKNLTHALVEADENFHRKRAQAIGQRIGGEDGAQYAVGLVEAYMSDWRNFKVEMSDIY